MFNKTQLIYPISILKPLEMVFPSHLKNLDNLIKRDNVIHTPLLADQETGIVLDGSHRYIFFLMNGYKTVPVKFVNYNDEHIRVGSRLIHRHLIDDNISISKKEVIERGMAGNLYPPRTTRHFFPFRKNEFINVKLSELERGKPVDISEFILISKIEDEIEHNNKYILEIEHEFDELIRYMEEVRQTKEYLKKQIQEMEKRK